MPQRFPFATLLALLLTLTLHAQTPLLPPGFALEEDWVTGLTEPTDLKVAPDGRIFVTEKGGAIRIVEHGELLPDPFFTVATQTPNERGLDGILLDPDFETNGYVYLYYTLPLVPQNVLARVTASGNYALPASYMELMRLDPMWASWHNGGGMEFDTTGRIILGVGDGTAWDKAGNLDYTLGKVLRLSPDGSIPADNPFLTITTGIHQAIAAYGVRNPYTMAVSRRSGRIFFNDVGGNLWEEVNEFQMGKNYGWPWVEGMLGAASPPDSNYVDPKFVYDHTYGCAIVGAAFYEPDSLMFPAMYDGWYFFMEYCNGKLLCMHPDSTTAVELGSGLKPGYNNLETAPDGHLYLTHFHDGKLSRLSYRGLLSPPLITQHPKSQTVAVGDTVVFSAASAGDTLTFDWHRGGTLVQSGPLSSFELPDAQVTDDGATFWVRVTNAHGVAVSDTATLTVVDGTRPVVTFVGIPATYSGGDTVPFAALVTDPDQAAVPAADLTWQVSFHHDEHEHPVFPPTAGLLDSSFVVERHSEQDTNVFFRIHLQARDSSGLVTHAFQDVLPEKVTLHFNSVPESVPIRLDGVSQNTPADLRSVRNIFRHAEAAPYAIAHDSVHQFVEWQDGMDSLSRTLSADDATYTLRYAALEPYQSLLPILGNREVYTDTAGSRVLYRTNTVWDIQENWDVLNPYRWDVPPFPEDYWSVIWDGTFCTPVAGLYHFYLLHDSKVALTIGDSLVLESTTAPSQIREDTVSLWLGISDTLSLHLVYDHYQYVARVELDWQYSILPREAVPFSYCTPPVGVTDPISGLQKLVVYPNPVSAGVFFVSLPKEMSTSGPVMVELFDIAGHRVMQLAPQLGGLGMQLDISHLPSGVYAVRVRNASGAALGAKVVKL